MCLVLSVFCAVHQPSAELFSHFDRLLLLKSGGREVFFGDLGEDGLNVAEYFTSAKLEPGFEQPELPEKVNIASWMLDVIGAGTVSFIRCILSYASLLACRSYCIDT